jgi:hypothetical protein
MWRKATWVIVRIDRNEWDCLDVIAKWLISTRAAVLVMTLLSPDGVGDSRTASVPLARTEMAACQQRRHPQPPPMA